MRAAVLHEYGTPVFDDFPDPVSTDEHVVVDVMAAGVNPVDVLVSSGTFYVKPPALPCGVGHDGVGRLPTGQTAYFEMVVPPFGSAAERTLVARESLIELPEGADAATAAALGNSGLAAWLSLQWRGRLAAGDTVLVLGASGSVGRLAVQIARLLGAGRVVAAGRHEPSLRRAVELGADEYVVLDRPETLSELRAATSHGADVILDLLWGAPAVLAAQVAAPGARLVQIGNSAGPEAVLPAGLVRSRGIEILGYSNLHVSRRQRHAAYRCLVEHTSAGRIAVDLERIALQDVATAWERQRAGTQSKLVLTPVAE